jgi:hypothetical protein
MIGRKIIDRKTGDECTIIGYSLVYIPNDRHRLIFKIEFEIDEDFLIVKRDFKELLFIKED